MIKEDWQKPEETELTALQRTVLHSEWLKRQHEEIKRKIEEKKPVIEQEEIPGGFDD